MASSIPAVLVGVMKPMGSRVATRLAPEVEVIQFVNSVERAKSDIAALRSGRGQEISDEADNPGTQDFSKKPQIVIFGRGFGPEKVADIRDAVGGSSAGLTWLQTEAESRAKVMASPLDMNDQESLDRYAAKTAASVKKVILGLQSEGKLGTDGMYTYV